MAILTAAALSASSAIAHTKISNQAYRTIFLTPVLYAVTRDRILFFLSTEKKEAESYLQERFSNQPYNGYAVEVIMGEVHAASHN